MAVEQYEVLKHSVLTKAVRMFEPPPDMLGAKIFKTEEVIGETAGIDIEYNPRHMASYRHPDAEAGTQALMKVKHIDVTLPCLKEKKKIPARVLNVLRQPGTEHTKWGEKKIAEELRALDIIVTNRMEWARWQILQTGKVAITTGDIQFSIDFGMASSHKPTLAGSDQWSNPSTADPVSDIMSWKRLYAQDCGKNAKIAICTSTVMGYLMASDKVRQLMGESFKTQVLQSGRITRLLELDWWVYDHGYVPEGGSFTNFLGTDKVILWSGDPVPEYVGIFPDVKAKTPGKFSKSWEEEDPSGIWVMLGVNSIPSGERVEELFCADVA